MEYDVIARITYRLKKAVEGKELGPLISALHENRKLWRTLASNVADPDNPLPKELRARLYYLSEFTNHHTSEVIRKNASAMPLIEVNTAILRGLKSEGALT